jgi:hypothetical protein
LILDDVIEGYEFSQKNWVARQKSRAAKVNEFYTNPLRKVIFSAFLANYGRKPMQAPCPRIHQRAIFAAVYCLS